MRIRSLLGVIAAARDIMWCVDGLGVASFGEITNRLEAGGSQFSADAA